MFLLLHLSLGARHFGFWTLGNRAIWKLRNVCCCLDARFAFGEIFYHANELWCDVLLPRQSSISCVEHNLFISSIRTWSFDRSHLLQEIKTGSIILFLLCFCGLRQNEVVCGKDSRRVILLWFVSECPTNEDGVVFVVMERSQTSNG